MLLLLEGCEGGEELAKAIVDASSVHLTNSDVWKHKAARVDRVKLDEDILVGSSLLILVLLMYLMTNLHKVRVKVS